MRFLTTLLLLGLLFSFPAFAQDSEPLDPPDAGEVQSADDSDEKAESNTPDDESNNEALDDSQTPDQAAADKLPLSADELSKIAAQFGIKLLGALAVLIIAWIAAGIVAQLLTRSLEKAEFDLTLTKFFARLVRWLVLLLGVLACLSLFGIETTSFAAVLGGASLAVGLALQGTLSHFASGVMLLVFRPFDVGDVVNIAGHTGKVDAIELFTTTIDTFDNRRIVVPNGSVFGSTIENITHHPHRRADVAVGTAYDADLEKTREVLMKAAESVPDRLSDPEPAVVLLELGASSIDWSVRVWAKNDDFGAVKQATILAVKNALDEAGIGIPYPQMDVHLDKSAE